MGPNNKGPNVFNILGVMVDGLLEIVERKYQAGDADERRIRWPITKNTSMRKYVTYRNVATPFRLEAGSSQQTINAA